MRYTLLGNSGLRVSEVALARGWSTFAGLQIEYSSSSAKSNGS